MSGWLKDPSHAPLLAAFGVGTFVGALLVISVFLAR